MLQKYSPPPYLGERKRDNFVEKKRIKNKEICRKKDVCYILGSTQKASLDMGESFFENLEQVSEFSTFEVGYPQVLASYPQYRGTIGKFPSPYLEIV
jgi:hypothetical protein